MTNPESERVGELYYTVDIVDGRARIRWEMTERMDTILQLHCQQLGLDYEQVLAAWGQQIVDDHPEEFNAMIEDWEEAQDEPHSS